MHSWFDPELIPAAWFDPELDPLAWFDHELVNQATGPASHNLTGSLVGAGSTVTGAINRTGTHTLTGVLIGQQSVITGASSSFTPHNLTNALTGQGALVTGAINRFRSHDLTGTLISEQSLLAGAMARAAGGVSHDLTGILIGQQSIIDGLTWNFQSFWPDNPTPGNTGNTDPVATEIGTQFSSDVSGQIYGVKWYKQTTDTGTHTLSLWDNTGTLLAQVTQTNETASGWQYMLFSSPVSITASTTYVVSRHSPNGNFALTSGGFASALTVGHLTAPATVNGRYYQTASTPTYPTNPFGNIGNNYFVDPLFKPSVTTHDLTGALIGQGSVITGNVARFRAFSLSGQLIGHGSLLTGAASRTRQHGLTGQLIAQGSLLSGTTTRFRAFSLSGNLIGQGSIVTGSTNRFRLHDLSGALVGSGAVVTGSLTRTGAAINHALTGNLIGQGSTLIGVLTKTDNSQNSGGFVASGNYYYRKRRTPLRVQKTEQKRHELIENDNNSDLLQINDANLSLAQQKEKRKASARAVKFAQKRLYDAEQAMLRAKDDLDAENMRLITYLEQQEAEIEEENIIVRIMMELL